ncbi:MAG TPA: folylpolyglutamate synthase/dihydrofolate synthase family protein [Acidimicrobiales bacterium]|nr:folylpolyglutamate synthase/dihydrofolate synthase family protein [Acidimicrobiales bacterium]
MNFGDALVFLDEHINLEATLDGPKAGAVHGLSLDRMRGIVEVLGDPQASAPVIHVTGTNGKGSTSRIITALLGAHGLTVGTYASPHLESITERIRRNVDSISEEDFGDIMGEIAALEPMFPDRPSYFDLLTAAAFAWFAREAVEVMVLEVGMLGRYDSTNVASADVAVITNVGRDHTDFRGDWRRAIAEEKAGIIEDRSAVVIGETDPDLVEVFRAEGGSMHWVRDEHFGVRSSLVALGGRHADLYTPGSRLEELYLPLHGAHQVDNASIAIAAVEAFFGRPLDRDVVQEALRSLEIPGRFEVIDRAPLIVLDMAHNPDGAEAVADTYTSEFHPEGGLTVVVGMLGGRDPDDTLAPLLALRPRRVICTRADSPRSVPAADIAAAVARGLGDHVAEVRTIDDVDGAVRKAVDLLGDDEALLVTGSTYVVGAARATLRSLGFNARR